MINFNRQASEKTDAEDTSRMRKMAIRQILTINHSIRLQIKLHTSRETKGGENEIVKKKRLKEKESRERKVKRWQEMVSKKAVNL